MNQAKAEFFDSQVHEPWAASQFGPEEMSKIDRMLAHARLSEGMRVIEPGCGTGRLTSILADVVGPAGFVLALDISSKMIEAARRVMGARDNVLLECASVENYRLEPGAFDLVVCHNVFPHFDRKKAVVFHLASALKAGGRFIVFHFMNSEDINDLHRKAHPSVMKDLLPHEREMRDLFGNAGFEIDTLKDDDSGYLLSATRP